MAKTGTAPQESKEDIQIESSNYVRDNAQLTVGGGVHHGGRIENQNIKNTYHYYYGACERLAAGGVARQNHTSTSNSYEHSERGRLIQRVRPQEKQEPEPISPEADEPEDDLEVPIRKALAVTNWPGGNLRAYFQDSDAHVWELSQKVRNQSSWKIGSEHIGISDAKPWSPLAVINRFKGQEIHVFYISNQNIVRQRSFYERRGWTDGCLNGRDFAASIASQLVTVASSSTIKVYYQSKSGAINEFSHSDSGTDVSWEHKTTPAIAIRGSSLAAVALSGENNLIVHLYYQALDCRVKEHRWKNSSWREGKLPQTSTEPHALLAAHSWGNSTQIGLYWRASSGIVIERRSFGETWEKITRELSPLSSFALGSQFVVLEDAFMSVLRAYFLTDDNKIGETAYNKMKRKWNAAVQKGYVL